MPQAEPLHSLPSRVLIGWHSVGFSRPPPRCQNWEGGIGGVPGMEAHGGYTFCGLAALVILKKERSLNLKSLLVSTWWSVFPSGPRPLGCDLSDMPGSGTFVCVKSCQFLPWAPGWQSCNKASDAVVGSPSTVTRECRGWASALGLGSLLPAFPSPALNLLHRVLGQPRSLPESLRQLGRATVPASYF